MCFYFNGLMFTYSDIRGVAVAGIEGEPINLTEPVSEAIAAGFASWLVEKKKADSKRLRVSVGHDSRISAQKLEVCLKCNSMFEFKFDFFVLLQSLTLFRLLD